MYPEEYRYSKDHEWILDQGGIGTIGITDYAQKELGDVVYVDLPEVGDTFEANEPFGQVESVKAVSEVYSPVTGEVAAVNSKLQDAPEKINADPHGNAWLIRVRLADHHEIEALMTAEQYQAYLKEEAGH